MKSLKKLLIPALAVMTLATACNDKKSNPTPTPTPGTLANGSTLEGEITSNTTLSAGNTYTLKGGVHVKSGATLTIEKGVTVKSDANEPATAYLLIEPGAKINAVGTATEPIVFTSGKATPAVQDWGGIIVCGKAPINVTGGQNASEMGAGVTYGGTDAADNSGTIQYVRVEYTGKKQNQTKEHNGFTFEGVGSGTTVDHIAVYKGADDGIEFFGGTVNVKYFFAYGAQDDCIDWTYGWTGSMQYAVAVQADDVADRGFEGDNNGSNNTLTPYSSPKIANVTLVGSLIAGTDDGNGGLATGKTRAMKLREGTKGMIYNVVAYNFSSGIECQHDQSLANMNDGSLVIKGLHLENASHFKYAPSTGSYTGAKPFETEASNATAAAGTPSFISGKYVGTTASTVNASAIGLESAQFKGATATAWGTWTRM
ncbi:MAG: hypothetical protein R2800_14530 [Flavipsychrobacter sp.]